MKRYFTEYESDRMICGSYHHVCGFANSLKTAKGYISKARKLYAGENPRNFKIYDTQQDDENGCALCVYEER